MLTQSQIQASTDVKTLLDTTADCLQFVTEFFEVISQSAPHIYHSALLLAPQSSIIRRLYSQQTLSVARVVTGMPASWDSCTACVGTKEVSDAVWSPCGKFIAAGIGRIVEVRDSNTLERISDLKPPGHVLDVTISHITFSPSGHLLACSYLR
jgi:WD40 repeat protein